MAPDIEAAVKLLRDGEVWRKVKPMMDNYHSQQLRETPVCSPTSSYHPNTSRPTKRRRKSRQNSQNGLKAMKNSKTD